MGWFNPHDELYGKDCRQQIEGLSDAVRNPQILLNDNGSQLVSKTFREILNDKEI